MQRPHDDHLQHHASPLPRIAFWLAALGPMAPYVAGGVVVVGLVMGIVSFGMARDPKEKDWAFSAIGVGIINSIIIGWLSWWWWTNGYGG